MENAQENKTTENKAPQKHKAPKVVQTEPKEKKSAWSVERCLKAAHRFTSEEEWKKGAPSSYKAAVSHGWHAECCRSFTSHGETKFKKSA
jgi:hypothetical protein